MCAAAATYSTAGSVSRNSVASAAPHRTESVGGAAVGAVDGTNGIIIVGSPGIVGAPGSIRTIPGMIGTPGTVGTIPGIVPEPGVTPIPGIVPGPVVEAEAYGPEADGYVDAVRYDDHLSFGLLLFLLLLLLLGSDVAGCYRREFIFGEQRYRRSGSGRIYAVLITLRSGEPAGRRGGDEREEVRHA